MQRGPLLTEAFVVSLFVLFGSAACQRGVQGTDGSRSKGVFERGDVVVVERTASEFFEGRVLSVTPTSLKVQTSDEGEPVVVSRDDSYRVSEVQRESAPGAPAICNDRHAHWVACRVVRSQGSEVVVALREGGEVPLPRGRVMQPSAVTALNVRKVFEIGESRRRFGEAAVSAGHPRRPEGWLPEPHEPVLARRGNDWFSAHVVSNLEDGAVLVLFEGTDRSQSLLSAWVVPVPPHTRNFSRGDFALVRPKSATEPWQRVRVEAIGPEEAVVVAEDGERRRFEARQLVPVIPGP